MSDPLSDALTIGRYLADQLLAVLPHEQARILLDDAAAKRANLEADAAETIKFGPDGNPR